MTELDRQLLRACDVANADPDVAALEQELDALQDQPIEPWTDDRR